MVGRPKVGLALGSGGARGWAHLGVLSVLDEIGVRPGFIAGSSMGALVGAAEAGGARAELEAWARGLTQARFLRLMDFRFSAGGLVAGREIASVLGEWGLDVGIGALDIPFTAVATDLETGREVWLDDGPLLPAVRASVSIPGLFSPQHIDGRWLVDGGLTNPVPVSVARARGARVILAVNPNAKPSGRVWVPQPPGAGLWTRLAEALPEALRPEAAEPEPTPQGADVVAASIDMMMEYLRRTRAAADPADVTIEINLSALSSLSFFEAETAIAAGRAAAEAARPRIEAALEAVA
ncbi:patatin-like phospholipase family protein [Roseicyclus persicicus]|uniref:Patatin n=1 Tax=Roseicyclus persicicus TaxID=2650661 RepID=A0A7X6K0L9_9RHOB|nr:patatin-like phospholipase family protein [Roseibacterium persicicum]NKX46405.1 patatin [Roseibacterium persicicum]